MIYVNGDSWTSGWPDEETFGHREHSWPHLLSIQLGQQVLNDARAGSSNYRIYRRTFDYLLDNSPATAIVCLTSWIRIEHGNAETGKIFQYLPTTHPKIFKSNWHPYLAYATLLRQIISLQNIAKQTSTDLWLLDTFDNNLIKNPTYTWFVEILKNGGVVDAMDDERISQKFTKIVNLTKHIDFSMFIADDSYQTIISNCKKIKNHPTNDGHMYIANTVFNHLNKKENKHGQAI